MLPWVWGRGHLLVLVGLETGAATMKISVAVPQIAGNRPTTGSSYVTLGQVPKGLYTLL